MAAPGDDFGEADETGILLVTAPTIELSGPMSGVYQATVVTDDSDPLNLETSVIRAYVEHDEVEGRASLRLWTHGQALHLVLRDCGVYTAWPAPSAIDEWIPADTDLARGASFEPSGTTFGGVFSRQGETTRGEVAMHVRFTATASDLNGAGFYERLDIHIDAVVLDLVDPDLLGEDTCSSVNFREIPLRRVNPLWEP